MAVTCPFCKLEQPGTAEVCGGCGARYGTDTNMRMHPATRLALGLAGSVACGAMLWFLIAPDFAVVATLAFAILFLGRYRKERRRHWWRRF